MPLLDRANGRAELIAAGRVLVEHTERIVTDLERAETTLRQTTEAAGRQAVRLGQLDVAFASGYRQAPRAATSRLTTRWPLDRRGWPTSRGIGGPCRSTPTSAG